MFYEIFTTLCDDKKISPTATLQKIGVSTSKLTAWKNGSTPSVAVLILISEFFDVSIDYLIYGEDRIVNESEQEKGNSGQTINIKDIKDSNVNNFNRSEVTYHSDNSYSEITSHLDNLSLRDRRRAILAVIEFLEDNYPVKKK